MINLKLDARRFRWILIGIICLSLIAGAVGVWYVQKALTAQIIQSNDMKAAAENSTNQLRNAQSLKIYLANHQADIAAAAKIVADSNSYQYQNQIVSDINNFAAQAGVTVFGFTFPQTIDMVKPDSTGLKPLATILTLKSPVAYASYHNFLKLIEQNSTKMQVTDITITPDTTNPTLITNPTIGIEVYVNSK